MNTTKKRIGCYLRVSTNEQKINSQKKEVLDYCKKRFPKASLELFEEKASGADTSRPILENLIQAVRSGKIDTVVCYKLDRLGRSLSHLALIIEELDRLKVALVCCSQGIDTSNDNPSGRLQLHVLLAVAEFERGIIRERVNAGIKAAKANGVRFGRPSLPDTKKKKVIALINKGMGIREISRELGMPVSTVHKVKTEQRK